MLSNTFPTPRVPSGGIFIERRIQALRDAGVEVELWALGERPRGLETNMWNYAGPATTKRLLLNRFAPTRWGLGTWQRQILGVSRPVPDLVVAHGMYLPPAGAVARQLAAKLGRPFVVQVHGTDVNQVLPRHPRAFGRVLRSASGVVFVSHALQDATCRVIGELDNGHVVPNGVDLQTFFPTRQASASRKGVAFVGNLIAVKGADRIPALFEQIQAQIPGTPFTVAGDGPLREGLEAQCRSLGLSVTFLGSLSPDKVAQVLRETKVLVLPSRSEGWPCTILEAQASGASVVGTDVGGVAEAIGDRAAVVKPVDGDVVPALAGLVVARLRETSVDEAKFTDRARDFSWAAIAQRELLVYECALARSC